MRSKTVHLSFVFYQDVDKSSRRLYKSSAPHHHPPDVDAGLFGFTPDIGKVCTLYSPLLLDRRGGQFLVDLDYFPGLHHRRAGGEAFLRQFYPQNPGGEIRNCTENYLHPLPGINRSCFHYLWLQIFSHGLHPTL